MTSGEHWRLGRRPGLDGLRGIAVLLVVFAHSFPKLHSSTGGVGVVMFFALSGFLITTLLLEERTSTGQMSLRRFYERRARRLLPALVVYLAFWATLSAARIGPFRIQPGEVIVVLFYMANWMMAAGGGSHPTSITWSLSIEEQFYLLWPLVLVLGRRWPRLPYVVAIGGTAYALTLRGVSWALGGVPASYYFRSDTRLDCLLIGCLFALALHRGWRPPVRFAGLPAVIVLGLFLLNRNAGVRGVWESFVVPIATCAVIAVVLSGRFRFLEHPALRYLGRRSYALYLWHYPIVVLSWAGILPLWVALGLSLTAAEASWWLVERPFRRRRDYVAETVSAPAATVIVAAVTEDAKAPFMPLLPAVAADHVEK